MWRDVGDVAATFELSREREWRRIASVCREVAEFLTGPARGFDASADY